MQQQTYWLGMRMKRVPTVNKDQAVSLVRAALLDRSALDDLHLAVRDGAPRELWWAWVIPVQSQDPPHVVFGLGPYLVDKFTGEVIPTGSGTRLHPIERARGYRAWWDFRGPNWIAKL
jgi:hypothetical protein